MGKQGPLKLFPTKGRVNFELFGKESAIVNEARELVQQ